MHLCLEKEHYKESGSRVIKYTEERDVRGRENINIESDTLCGQEHDNI